MTRAELEKVPAPHAFVDVSDYAGPAGRWLARRLVGTCIAPNHLTLLFTLAGLAGAALLAVRQAPVLAASLLLVKSGLDAADGALARARQQPSRVGRFLDAVCDFVVNAAVFAALVAGGWTEHRQPGYLPLGVAAFVSALLQVSLFNHYYVRYRHASGGDLTSQASEAEAAGQPWDNPRLLAWLHHAYRLIYGWQDRLVARLDGWAARRPAPISAPFMSAASVLGLGTQLLVIAACALLGQPHAALWLFVLPFNLYAGALVLARRRAAGPPAPAPGR